MGSEMCIRDRNTDPIGFSSAVDLGIDMHKAALLDKIKSNIELTEKEVNID